MILAIDASTTATGYAHGGASEPVPRGGVWHLPGADELVLGRTITMVGQSIMNVARLVKPSVIYAEAPFAKIDREHSEQTAIALMQMAGGLRLTAGLLACRLELVSVFAVRKYFIGEGFLSRNAAKSRVQHRCDQLGWSYQDDNEADAKAVWAFGMSREVPGWRPNAPQLFDAGRLA